MYLTKIGHAHLKVRDLKRAIDFYTRFFSLKLVEQVGDQYAFLSGGDFHHEIALQNVGPHAPQPHPYGTGLYHVAFEVPDRRSLAIAAAEAGLRPIDLDYANEGEISPGAQLFMLASTLFSLGLYETVGQPNGNPAVWKMRIIS